MLNVGFNYMYFRSGSPQKDHVKQAVKQILDHGYCAADLCLCFLNHAKTDFHMARPIYHCFSPFSIPATSNTIF